MRIVVVGLTLSSSWGNGHATTYRALLKALAARGHDILFLECDRPWYAANRDMPSAPFCQLAFYDGAADLRHFDAAINAADLVVIGSYVDDGVHITKMLRPSARLLAFYDIDTPVTLARLHSGGAGYIDPETIPLYDIYLSFTAGPTLQTLQTRFGARCARALYCSADTVLYRPSSCNQPTRWDLGYIGTYSADRQPALESLLLQPARHAPQLRFVVAGPQYPETIDWPANVERIEHLGPADHPEFFANQTWTLNITRADMKRAGYSPSVRLFEASACATPVISDAWEGLNDIFRIGAEIKLARTAAEVLDILHSPAEVARQIGGAARQRVLADHSAEVRARQLEDIVLSIQPNAKGGSGLDRCLPSTS